MSARILAAADIFGALRQPRPRRPAIDAEEAERVLRDVVAPAASTATPRNAVLQAAGHRVGDGPACPAGLTPGGVDVVVRVAGGGSNPAIAEALGVLSRRTVTSHLRGHVREART